MPPSADATPQPAAPAAEQYPEQPPSPWRSVGTALGWLLAAEAVSFCATFLAGFAGGFMQARGRLPTFPLQPPWPLIYGLTSLIAMQAMLLLADWRQGRVLGGGDLTRGLGAGPMQRRRLVALLLILMIGWVCLYVMLLIYFQGVARHITAGLAPLLAAQMSKRSAVLVIRLLLIVLVAPVAEELFFRGWLWTALRRSWGVWATACLTGGLWLALHALGGVVRVPILLPAALLLSLARHYGGSVRASVPLHVANNATAIAIQTASVFLLPP